VKSRGKILMIIGVIYEIELRKSVDEYISDNIMNVVCNRRRGIIVVYIVDSRLRWVMGVEGVELIED